VSSDPERLLTEKEYLAIERRAEFRSEFYNGEMFALAVASRRHNMVLTNLVIFEVLSDSTEAYDRGRKFEHYQNVDSLLTYVLVARDPPRIERYVRQRGVRPESTPSPTRPMLRSASRSHRLRTQARRRIREGLTYSKDEDSKPK
jgi:hypothetical protein